MLIARTSFGFLSFVAMAVSGWRSVLYFSGILAIDAETKRKKPESLSEMAVLSFSKQR